MPRSSRPGEDGPASDFRSWRDRPTTDDPNDGAGASPEPAKPKVTRARATVDKASARTAKPVARTPNTAIDAQNPLIMVPAALNGFLLNPAWYVWLGLELWRGRRA